MTPKRNSSLWKPWTSKRELEELRQEEARMREEIRQKEQLEWQRQREKQDLQDRLDREKEKAVKERRERVLWETRVREQEAAYREAEARRQEIARQEQAHAQQLQREARERQERQELEAREEERRRKNEELRKQVKKQEERLARIQKLKLISPDSLYVLRELIRQKYALDVEIWSLRRVRLVDRGEVEDKMEKADAILQEIRDIVGAWQGTEKSWDSPAEWARAQEIQERLLSDGKREWRKNPPWKDL
jgi:hypothetical protein